MSNNDNWKTKYKSQIRWKENHHYKTMSFRVYESVRKQIQLLAHEKQIPLSKLICEALEFKYGIDLSHPPEATQQKSSCQRTDNHDNKSTFL